jgi:hypothetical protein
LSQTTLYLFLAIALEEAAPASLYKLINFMFIIRELKN